MKVIILTFIIFACFYSLPCKSTAGRKYLAALETVRIVGGRDCDLPSHRYMVSVQFPTNKLRHQCGGTLIASKYVLTAAHCLSHNVALSEYVVVAGISDTAEIKSRLIVRGDWEFIKGNHHFYGQMSGVDTIIIHADFDIKTYHNDIALMNLHKIIKPSEKVNFVSLPKQKEYFLTSNICVAVGWGVQIPMLSRHIKYETNATITRSSKLQCVPLPLIDNNACDEYLRENGKSPTFREQICTLYGPGGKDACYGDSGGPLVCNDSQIGIISTGWGCALPKRPALYTRIDYYSDWILQNIEYLSSSYVESEAILSSAVVIVTTLYFYIIPFYFCTFIIYITGSW